MPDPSTYNVEAMDLIAEGSHPGETSTWQLTRLDVAGAFGDIGVLFPIAIALVSLNGLNPTAVFLAAGLTYILAGWYFQVPMPVQPLKAVAAIALATGLPSSAIASAGLMMGVVLAVVAVTNTANWLVKLFTLPIVRGIQLGLGLLLVREGLRLMLGSQSILKVSNGFALRGWEIAVPAAILLWLFGKSTRYPAALILLIGGVCLGILGAWGKGLNAVWGPLPLSLLHPHTDELRKVFTLLVIPQFALTFGNSIVATENTAKILYGAQARRVTIRGLSMSIALVNLISGMLQGAPMCHGSGGITAHYKFGARTAKSNYIVGTACLILALLGTAAMGVLHLIPIAVLGVFLVYVGIQHAAYLRDIFKQTLLLLIAISVGVVALLTTNLMWGFLVGFVLQGVLLTYERYRGHLS
ncbi:MAG TPA: molybdate transporter family protein [Terriglobales bacterium]|nr:molybdate transporter family protein [Terriglobales bacterium]